METRLKLTLDEWDASVGRHLQLIEAGAEIAENHARALLGMPDWDTYAMDRIVKTERLLGKALCRIARARQMMENKPHVG